MAGLYRVPRGRTHYCGPVALAALTGLSPSLARSEINLHRRRALTAPVTGSTRHELLRVLRKWGYTTHKIRVPKKNGKKVRLSDINGLAWQATHLIETTTHFVAFKDGLVVDNQMPNGKLLSEHPHRLSRITDIWIVYPPKRGAV